MTRYRLAIAGGCAAAAICAIAVPAVAWGPHPLADSARGHLAEAIREMEQVSHENPQGSFGGHEGKAQVLARQALVEFDEGMRYRSRLP